jgi:hypothetical protein
MLRWDTQLEEANQQIAELEDRISALKQELEVAQRAADAARVQRILAVREQQLDHLKFWARFIEEEKIARGHREVKPLPYSEFAVICFDAANREPQGEAAKRLRAIGSSFAAKGFQARAAARKPRLADRAALVEPEQPPVSVGERE